MRRTVFILMLIAAMVVASCERRPLTDLSTTHYVRVYVDEELLNVTTGFYDEQNQRPFYKSPDILRIILADPQTGDAIAERFLRNKGVDENGSYYDGYIVAYPGQYCLLAYNFDTEMTMVQDMNNHFKAKAYTNEIAPHLKTRIPSRATDNSESIVYDPDHLFSASCGEVIVPYVDYVDTLKTVDGGWFRAESIVKSYYLQVRVKGLEFASSSVGLMTGMAGSAWLNGAGMDHANPVTVYFEMLPGATPAAGVKRNQADGVSTIYTTFSTFGKLPHEDNELEITFDFLTIYGEPYSETIDITHVFATKEAVENQWLLLDHTIVIPEPPDLSDDGGFKPDLEDWKDEETDVIL